MAVRAVDFGPVAPDFLLKVQGTQLGEDLLPFVRSVEYHEGEELSSKIVLLLSNTGFRFNDSKVFAEGNEVDLWLGFAGKPLAFQNRGVVVKPNPDMPRQGIPTYQVVCHDRSRELMKDSLRGQVFPKARDDEIVRLLLGAAGITGGSDVREVRGLRTRRLKKGTSPWELIQRIGRKHGFELTVRYDPKRGRWRAYWGPPEEAEPQEQRFRFSYGTGEPDATLVEFHPNMSLPSQVSKIEIAYTDAKTRRTRRMFLEVDRARAERTKFSGAEATQRLQRPVGNGPSVTFTVFGQREEVLADYPFLTPKQARQLCAAWWQRREREFVFGRGVLNPGEPTLRRGQVHDLDLPSVRLSGEWIITSVVQRMGSRRPYETEFTAAKRVLQSPVGVAGNDARVRQTETAN